MAAAEDLPFACSEDGCTAVSSNFTAARSDALCMIYVFMSASLFNVLNLCDTFGSCLFVLCTQGTNVFWFNFGIPNA